MQTPEYKPLTIGDWIVTKIILLIPLVNLIMLLVWALSSDTHPSKKSFCQAALIMAVCMIGLMIVAMIVLGGFTAIMSHAVQQQGHLQ